MIKLEIHELQWINGSADDPKDQCAHGRVNFEVNGTVFVKPEDGLWTVSAAGLYLLRSLSEDHTPSNSIADGFLFPCCGFDVWLIGTRFKVVCIGCPSGIDVSITHTNGEVVLHSPSGTESLSSSAWREAVLAFVSKVRNFYQVSSPKEAIQDELGKPGWAAFWQEWDERYANATSSPA
jgi:hypothetical protein